MSKRKDNNMFHAPGNGPNTLFLLLAIIGGFVLYLMWYGDMAEERHLTYSQFVSDVQKGNVSYVVVNNGMFVQGRYKTIEKDESPSEEKDGKLVEQPKRFTVEVYPSDSLWNTLYHYGVNVEFNNQERGPWGGAMLLWFLLLIGIIGAAYWYMRNMQSGSGGGPSRMLGISKSRARFHSPSSVKTTFKDVAGALEAKEELKDVVEFLKNPEKFERLGAKIPRGVLLSGAPGNGKTLLAKAVAGEAHCPFLSISGSDFVEVFVGVGASRVRDLFIQARRNAPCIVFIDEIDAVGRMRGVSATGGNDEREQTLNQLLAEMDGFATERGRVIVLAATNRPDVLDKALLRPGRFDRTVEVPYPDMRSRKQILGVHVKGVPVSPQVDIESIARGTPGFSGAELANLINEAALIASKADKSMVDVNDFETARDRLLLGAERKTMILTDDDRRMTAYHEGGHALLNMILPNTDPFHKVTIIPRGRALGVSHSLPERDQHTHSYNWMIERVQVALGGLIAEKMIFNEQSTGAGSDIRTATSIIRAMVCEYGMSNLGPITFSNAENDGRYMSGQKGYSEETAQKIDGEIERIMSDCLAKAEKLLADNRDKLEKLAQALLEKETLGANEAYDLLGLERRQAHSFDENPDAQDEASANDDETPVEPSEA